MKKTSKPGAKFNAFQKKKKQYSESDMGSMKNYDPTGGLGNKGYAAARKAMPNKSVAKPITASPRYPAKTGSVGGVKNFGGIGGLQGGYGAGKPGHQNVGSTEYKKKHSKKHKTKKPIHSSMKFPKQGLHHKNWIAGAIKHPGALHAELGVKQGNKIPAKTLAKAAKKGGVEGKRARLAETLKGFKHKKMSSSKHCKTCKC